VLNSNPISAFKTPLAILVSTLLGLHLFTACASPPPFSLPDKSLETETPATGVTIRRSSARFHSLLRDGSPVHIAFLGGSITQSPDGHVKTVSAWFKQRYPGSPLLVTNAGLSSTCSTSGAFRLGRDVLSQGPVDLLIVEFAVNDDQDARHTRQAAIRGMEGIVRATLKHNPSAEILIVHFVNRAMLDSYSRGTNSPHHRGP
jgi:hypothetical protein